jgi:hypothetical protein
MLSVIMLSVVVLSVISLSVVLLSVVMLSVFMLNVVAPFLCHFVHHMNLDVLDLYIIHHR